MFLSFQEADGSFSSQLREKATLANQIEALDQGRTSEGAWVVDTRASTNDSERDRREEEQEKTESAVTAGTEDGSATGKNGEVSIEC